MAPEQKARALERAQEVRLEAAQLRATIRAGGRRAGAQRAARVVLAGESAMTFYRLLCAVPQIGHTTANTMLTAARIHPEARVDAERVDRRRRQLLAGELLRWGNSRR